MKWIDLFTSSVGKKFIMGLTGISLIAFLIVHAGLNACIWANDNGEMFNTAAYFMGHTVVIRIAEIGLFAGILLHIVQGLVLVFQNQRKRTVKYAVPIKDGKSKWYSRSMGLLGTLVLLFLVMHIAHFWVPSRITHTLDEVQLGLKTGENLYARMLDVFQSPLVVILYVLGCISLCYHLMHGFQSAFRTFGVRNDRYLSILTPVGVWFSIIICATFAMMPISMYLGWVN
ncbi:succinate dehydrogenase cytochrome b subunit [Gynurincola endophyticus]|uniref:succinate dehydrogenase cytochrome b subunit n=1 Tax=Gynurincola endophyticus TaxID=2479004 RepID=UPI000F8F2488|nr:succinate dehydrogenase cytochrome b subunit [Gynurincola endophyticus]